MATWLSLFLTIRNSCTRRLWIRSLLLQRPRQRLLPLSLNIVLIHSHNKHFPISPLHTPPPWPVDQNRPYSYNNKKPAYAPANNVKVVSNGRDAVPEAARRVCHVLRQ